MFTIIIPTYDHKDTVKYALESVLRQSYQDFEVFVIGDGAPPRTASIMADIVHRDSRIHYLENPKGEGYGELYRHEAIQQANGNFIAYLGDDDLWLPDHLNTLRAYLDDYDFVHTIQPDITRDGQVFFHANDLSYQITRDRMLTEQFNFFGPTVVAHRRDAYLKLPFGWRPKLAELWSDLYMWRQWLEQPEIRFKTIFKVTVVHLPSPQRKNMTVNERCSEMRDWLNNIDSSLLEMKHLTEDEAEAIKTMKLFPETKHLQNLRCEIALQQGKPEEAKLIAEENLSKSADKLDASIKLSFALEKLANHKAAIEAIEAAEKYHPNNIRLLARKAKLLIPFRFFRIFDYFH